MAFATAEHKRLEEAREKGVPWRKWGPYLSERQWGTVREDYSEIGNPWEYFSHDQARSRAFRWGEDGLAGFSDEKSRLCFALALWNGADPILKERLFGLTNSEGNHGEDVKEYYFYLDATPTHSYNKWLYKYPQRAFPYADLVEESRRRGRHDLEYELLDTGVFEGDRYFDVLTEYAKASPEDILIRITVINRGPEAARLHVLPTLWFRNTWSWGEATSKPRLEAAAGPPGAAAIVARHPQLGERWLYADDGPSLLFTANETNLERIFGTPNRTPYVKDGIHEFLVNGNTGAVNPGRTGTKAAAHYPLTVGPGEISVIHLRLSDLGPSALKHVRQPSDRHPFNARFDDVFAARQREADEFYAAITPPSVSRDAANVMRQALAGMLWGKQHYFFDLDRWLDEHGAGLNAGGAREHVRNRDWFHMLNDDVISMPDKWEYPWYAAWDLAFHAVALSAVDTDLAKQQLDLMLRELYLHPSGQMPAYEWNFGDVNPPVHAWATLFVYLTEKQERGKGDLGFLKSAFQKLLVNFTWWVNRKDPTGKNVFEGGFLGLDNIGVFDRSSALPPGVRLEQADGTAWMALFSQNMLQIALELALEDSTYQDMAVKFTEHFFWIASAMDRVGEHQDAMWDEQDGFFYDLLRLPDGRAAHLKVRSLVGLLPLCAATVFEPGHTQRFPRFMERARFFLKRHPDVAATVAPPDRRGVGNRGLLALLGEERLRRVLTRMLDENEFLSPYGIRSLSRHHLEHPYLFPEAGKTWRVDYEPAESRSGLFGGNSNWRGPVWFPINALLIRSLLQYDTFYGDDFKIECPTGSGQSMNLFEVAKEIADRLTKIFLRDSKGRRPVHGGAERFQTDPHWKNSVLFYEYFHADNGAGLGASHQTGWTGLVARMIQLFGAADRQQLLEGGVRKILTPG